MSDLTPVSDRPANILVVDDLPEKLLVYETILAPLNERLVLVSSGARALKQVLETQFAVILLDVNMPDMDGFETARLIRGHRRSSSTPIIFLTAFSDDVRIAEGYASGAVDYLPTPVVPQVLQAKVRVFVELYKMRTQAAERAEEQARRMAVEEANRRLTFLSDASAVLGSSLNLQTTARALVALPVPFLADQSFLYFGDATPIVSLHLQVRTAGSEPEVAETETLQELPVEIQKLARQSFERGKVEHWTRPDSAYTALPLQARDRTLAVLILGRSQPPSEGGLDVTLAVALASRAATALDNALLHEELVKADRQKVDFLSMLAHELRNPLAPICNSVQLMKLLLKPERGPVREAGAIIERQVTQLVRLIDDLLDVSRITSGKIRLKQEAVDLRHVVGLAVEASQPMFDARQHQLAVRLPESPVIVQGDATRLTQVITNLLNNAAKYTPDGGAVDMTLEATGGTAVVIVRDNGIGIPREMLQSIFDLFTQDVRTLDRSSGGLGIGLTLVRRLMEMHGGTIHAESDGPGRGARFTVALPMVSPAETPPGIVSAAPPPLPGTDVERHRILIVDDNTDAADTLAMLCRLGGHEVEVAYDGQACLPLARDFQPQIVMLDIGLPGLDGYEVARRLRDSENSRNALLVAISGYGQPMDEARSRAAGFDAHYVKPIDQANLQTILSRRHQEPAAAATQAAHFP